MPPAAPKKDPIKYFKDKYGETPDGKQVVGMSKNSPVYSDKNTTNAIDIERERFASKYGAAPEGQELIGMKSGKPVYGSTATDSTYKTPTPEETSAVFQELENTGGGGYNPATDPENIDKRKELASILKQFARREVKVNPEDLVKSGATMGVSRSQLSNLYQQYRKDFQNNPPMDLIGGPEGFAVFGEKLGLKPPTTPPTGTPTGTTPTQPSLFSGEYQKEGPVKGPFITSTTPAATPTQAPPAGTQDSGPATPRLDRLAAMQGTPMSSVSIGATGGLARGSSPTRGTPIGGGMGVGASPFGTRSSSAQRMNNITGANLFMAEQGRFQQQEQQNLENERLRAEIDAYKKANPRLLDTQFENANEKVPYFLRK
jgi:hypothetical protein